MKLIRFLQPNVFTVGLGSWTRSPCPSTTRNWRNRGRSEMISCFILITLDNHMLSEISSDFPSFFLPKTSKSSTLMFYLPKLAWPLVIFLFLMECVPISPLSPFSSALFIINYLEIILSLSVLGFLKCLMSSRISASSSLVTWSSLGSRERISSTSSSKSSPFFFKND